jgi:hypothetical protein
MSEFDEVLFTQHMHDAVVAHGEGRYRDALGIRALARDIAPQGSSELGRVYRDDAADYDRLGMPDEAEAAAGEAFRIHDALVGTPADTGREAYRERSVSSMYVAATGLRKVIKMMRAGQQPPTELMTTIDERGLMAWSDIREAKKRGDRFMDRRLDQYEINEVRRMSMIETINGNRARGLRLAAKSLAMAPFSESRLLSTSDKEFTRGQRYKAKLKATLGGVAALGFGVGMTSTPGRRQEWILRQADRAL